MKFEILEKEIVGPNQDFQNHCLPLYTGPVSCGLFGIADDFSENYLSLDEKYIKNREATFFVRAGGDSMEPDIKMGDILIVDRSIKLSSGHIATFFYNGHAVCKQYLKNSKGIFLHSLNSNYKDIKITETDQLELFGVVTGLARDFF